MKKLILTFAATFLAVSPLVAKPAKRFPSGPVEVRIIGLNDFHGNLEPPKASVEAIGPDGKRMPVAAGGAAYLASAVDSLRKGHASTIVVGAGDLISASPLPSALFLDEPAIMAMNMVGMEFSSVGNHEFDKGTDELKRMQAGGCAKFTKAVPCRIDAKFSGAKYKYLAANVLNPDGTTLFPSYGLKSFGKGRAKVTIGFIGMTLQGTGEIVSKNRIGGVTFADEADTANALVPKLKAAGADAIVVLIHQGVSIKADFNDTACGGINGDLLDVLKRLSPEVDVVVSGHTHRAYVCDYGKIDAAKPILFTSAGYAGELVTAIDLKIDPSTKKVIAKSARNTIVQSEAFTGARGEVWLHPQFPIFTPRADVDALVKRYVAAARLESARIVGSVAGPLTKTQTKNGESLLGNLIADAQLAATKGAGAQIAFMNPGGLRADVVPGADKKVTFGALYTAQPFSNQLVTKTLTGAQIRQVLEAQFTKPTWIRVLSPSSGFRFGYDQSKPEGSRILFATLDGVPIDDAKSYRVTVSDFLGNGGDGFPAFAGGADPVVGPVDLEALVAWVGRNGVTALPLLDRVENKGP